MVPFARASRAVICGVGSCLPPRILSNDQVSAEGGLETTDAWVQARTGIARRHRVDRGVSTGDLAVAAGRAALASAGSGTADAVLVATTTPDRRCPATAPEVAHRLGLGEVLAFDLAAVCSGFLYALAVADGLIAAGLCQRPLVIGAETYSSVIDPLDRDTALLFGDGAGATVLRAGDQREPGALLAVDLGSDGRNSSLIEIAAGGSRLPDTSPPLARDLRYFQMQGRKVYAQAVSRMTATSLAALRQVDWPADTVEAFIGHQANQRILDSVADRVGIAPERRFGNIRDVGNTAAASIPLALADTARHGNVRHGARSLFTAFGGGLTWASIALTWPQAQPHFLEPETLSIHPEPANPPWRSPSWRTSTPTS
ncbi:beta-ketoacyl-ACP synthase 3 [Streptomyces sp. TRM66268-LWL]|uniref:Beta-ketoacyl-[acyl-carrier-protein] synthase III n=1 Tax=Streptomyces polyasparticus TaxID=2767826 RepID=A0ABR7SZ45_9ACTN|nr:beta-ketoacyl-ACP synthase 3 [Streptomyces polyasparticus]MBC9719638.1 beta-ketoacyl-ACP synthase 3 [Streptomyces polyasparticus]